MSFRAGKFPLGKRLGRLLGRGKCSLLGIRSSEFSRLCTSIYYGDKLCTLLIRAFLRRFPPGKACKYFVLQLKQIQGRNQRGPAGLSSLFLLGKSSSLSDLRWVSMYQVRMFCISFELDVVQMFQRGKVGSSLILPQS